MSCTKHVLGVEWEQHSWRPRVVREETRSSHETDMWGRVNTTRHVLCHKQEVCEACGATREGVDCMCDPEEAAQCALRLACLSAIPEVKA